jgi:uncharacterized protein (DUF433 family)
MSDWKGFYSTSQVSRLAKIPISTLYTWHSRGIIHPNVSIYDQNDLKFDEGYSYAELTIIKILRALREDEIDLTSAGVALRHLYQRLGPPTSGWADANVYFVGKKIFAQKPDIWDTTAATQFGQKVEPRLFGDLFTELRSREESGSILVPPEFARFVEINPDIMGGHPVVKGTRLPTSTLAVLRQKGKTISEIAKLYASLSRDKIEKAIAYEEYLDFQTTAA